MKLYNSILTLVLVTGSCTSSSDTFREEGEIFHAAPPTHSVAGELYFGLYNDNTYEICNNGGLGQDCYCGKFKLDRDTLTLLDLDRNVPLKSNKLFILRYAEQDSMYWKRKYRNNPSSWQDVKWHDTINGLGAVYQLDNNNRLLNDTKDDYFLIRLDSLKNYR
jgi:hypothetical protein